MLPTVTRSPSKSKKLPSEKACFASNKRWQSKEELQAFMQKHLDVNRFELPPEARRRRAEYYAKIHEALEVLRIEITSIERRKEVLVETVKKIEKEIRHRNDGADSLKERLRRYSDELESPPCVAAHPPLHFDFNYHIPPSSSCSCPSPENLHKRNTSDNVERETPRQLYSPFFSHSDPLMSSRAILDSSPVRGHPSHHVAAAKRETTAAARPKSLKRSASTASLLTPPRTVQSKGRKRSKSRSSDDEETDGDDDGDSKRVDRPSVQRVLFAGHKRQRTERLDAVLASLSDGENEDENPFRDDDDDHGALSDGGQQGLSSPVTFRINKAPASPPPSRRQAAKSATLKTTASSSSQVEVDLEDDDTPRTPDRKTKSPIRDTPNNPFLEDDDYSPMSATEEVAEPSTPTDRHAEKPTIQYVFRGVRATFANPLYELPSSVRELALLPPEHPDFEPDPLCPPKLLFPEARSKARKAKHRSTSPPETRGRKQVMSRNRSRSDGDEWDTDDMRLQITPPRTLNRAAQSRS